MTAEESLLHPWIKVTANLMAFQSIFFPFLFLLHRVVARCLSYNKRLFQPITRKQEANRNRSSINMKNFKKFNARRKWKVILDIYAELLLVYSWAFKGCSGDVIGNEIKEK